MLKKEKKNLFTLQSTKFLKGRKRKNSYFRENHFKILSHNFLLFDLISDLIGKCKKAVIFVLTRYSSDVLLTLLSVSIIISCFELKEKKGKQKKCIQKDCVEEW